MYISRLHEVELSLSEILMHEACAVEQRFHNCLNCIQTTINWWHQTKENIALENQNCNADDVNENSPFNNMIGKSSYST